METELAFIELHDYEKNPRETQRLAGNPEQAKGVAAYEKQLQQKISEIAADKVNNQ